eukprot:5974103-Prymnesium_polylepis.1
MIRVSRQPPQLLNPPLIRFKPPQGAVMCTSPPLGHITSSVITRHPPRASGWEPYLPFCSPRPTDSSPQPRIGEERGRPRWA